MDPAITQLTSVTQLINAWQSGDADAETRLFETLYRTLRGKALQALRRDHHANSLSPTTLVHEAYLSLNKSKQLTVHDRDHFLKLAGRVMRNLVVDHARRRRALIHGGDLQRADWQEDWGRIGAVRTASDAEQILAVASAIDRLAAHSPHLAELVELRFFSGFTEDEIAAIRGVATRTVRRQWAIAKAHLYESLYN